MAFPSEAATRTLYALAVRDPRFLSAEPTLALRAHLNALLLFAPISHASLWLAEGDQEVCAARVGTAVAPRRLRRITRRAVNVGTERRLCGASILYAVPVLRWGLAKGALIVEANARGAARALDHASEAALTLSPLLERLLPFDQTPLATAQLLQAADRRVARLGFDLHDGPLQNLSLHVLDLATFGRQFQMLVPDEGHRRIAERRLEDLMTSAGEIVDDLREMAASGGRAASSLTDALERAVARFERRTGVDARLIVEGDVERTTPSQRIAVARVVEEALANVREHSRATDVHILVSREEDLRLSIVDNGHGFDVARARRRAARDRRLGLTVMAQRVRLLGGHLEIDSRSGGPTSVLARLPAWQSDAAEA
jgi:signal transduction histidine kinase